MNQEPYSFQNVYLITTYRCNWKCPFCLFRFNEEKEAPIDLIIERLRYSIEHSNQRVYLKITGGEPFIRLDLMEEVFKLTNQYQDKVYKIGIGTNGSIKLPSYFNDVKTRLHIFLSRHDVNDIYQTPAELAGKVNNPLIDFRVNCNLIKGGVDSISKVRSYIADKFYKSGITHICFRELSKVSIDKNQLYADEIYGYIKYYEERHVDPLGIENDLMSKGARYSRNTGNHYDQNRWYWYDLDGHRISIKFRSIDETRLIDFNVMTPDSVDEYVIHPDGTLTGCWDKDLKIIERGIS